MGISEDEYNARWDVILKKFGASIGAPSGWNEEEMFFSCNRPAIAVAYADRLTPEQRELVIQRAEKQFGV